MSKKIFFLACLLASLGLAYHARPMEHDEENEEVESISGANKPLAPESVAEQAIKRKNFIQFMVRSNLEGRSLEQQQQFLRDHIELRALEFLQEIFAYLPNLARQGDKCGKTPLHWAVISGCDVSIIQLILSSRGQLYNRYEDTHSLFKAIEKQNEDLLDMFLAAGAYITTKLEGKTPLAFAFYILDAVDDDNKPTARRIIIKLLRALLQEKNCSRDSNSLEEMLTSYASRLLHIIAAEADDAELLQALLKYMKAHGHPFDINAPDARNNTALHYAVSHHRANILTALLADSRIDVNMTNIGGRTALMMAASDNNIQFI